MLLNLPQRLRDTGLFCGYKKELQRGRYTKVPYNVQTGYRASPSKPEDFCTFASAYKLVNKYSGLGVGLFHGICIIDVDHCVNPDLTLNDFAKSILAIMGDCYVEYSPSKTGIHIIFYATDFCYDTSTYYIHNKKLGLEVYVYGATKKFLTVTGDVLVDGDILERGSELQVLLDTYMIRPTPLRKNQSQVAKSHLTDDSVIEKISTSKQAEKFYSLWNGSIPDGCSHSEADMALLSILAFWCGGDTTQMDRLFRKSKLMRDKWDRRLNASTYGQVSMDHAVAMTSTFYQPIVIPASVDFGGNTNSLGELHPEDASKYAWTDIGASRLFADYYKSIARYVAERKQWYYYSNGTWQPDTGSLKIMELCKTLADNLLVYALEIENESQRTSYIEYCKKWQQRRYRETILKDAQSIYPLSMSRFDIDPFVFNCSNGTLYLDTGEFTPHNPEDYLTKISKVTYDPTAHCQRFNHFINEITSGDKEKAIFLQKALGYGMTGDTRYECLFLLYGASTRNGKGTLCESVLKVLGSYGCTTRPESISLKSNSNSSNPSEDIARLAGVRFANISEPSRGLVLNAAQVKSMTGNDTLNARFLHENSFDYQPQFKLYINCNYLPVINDMTLFTSGRVIIIPFERHFDENEQDKSLKREFFKTENQSAILNWLLEGYQLLKKEGLKQPDSVRAATSAYQHDSDKIALFIEDELVESPNDELRTSDLYARYKSWCLTNGHFTENIKNFKQGLMSFGTITRQRPKTGGGATTLFLGYKYNDYFLW